MADVITRFKVETQEYDRKINQSKTKLKEFEKGGNDAGKALQEFSGKMGLSIGKLGMMGVAVGAASAALKVAKDAFFSCESNIDEWGRTTEAAKGAYDTFLQSITTGNWDNFLNKLTDAINGARNLYDAMDRLGSIKANNAAAIALEQQTIQQLRLKQQNGENVTDQLQAATERLAKLQGQEVEAGIEYGSKQMIQALKNAHISEDMAKAAVEELVKGGQDAFDKYAKLYEELTKAGTGKGEAVNWLGLDIVKYYKEGEFDEANLNEEQRKMYELARAITERETTLQKGIASYAQAVQQGTASAREQYKGNKYAESGNKGDKPIKKVKTDEQKWIDNELELNSIKNLQTGLSVLNKELLNAVDQDARDSATRMIERYKAEIERMKGGASISDKATPAYTGISSGVDMSKLKLDTRGLEYAAKYWENYTNGVKAANEANEKAINSISAVGSALSSIDDPAAKVMGMVAQAVANIALTFSKSLKGTVSPWDWIAAAASGTAVMISTISAIKSATAGSYADGGIIPGNIHSGDHQIAQVNAGELILNKAQQSAIASQLQSGSEGRKKVEFRISGQELVGILRQEQNIRAYR